MIELGRQFTRAAVRPWPGMSAQDSIIWVRAIETVTQPGDIIYYNVSIGPQREVAPNLPPGIQRQWQMANAKRIDLIVFRDNSYIIVEVRHLATSAALGRLLQYRTLWLQEWPTVSPDLLLVTDWIDPDLPKILLDAKISYLII